MGNVQWRGPSTRGQESGDVVDGDNTQNELWSGAKTR